LDKNKEKNMSIVQENEIKDLKNTLCLLGIQLKRLKQKIKMKRQEIYDTRIKLRFKKLEAKD